MCDCVDVCIPLRAMDFWHVRTHLCRGTTDPSFIHDWRWLQNSDVVSLFFWSVWLVHNMCSLFYTLSSVKWLFRYSIHFLLYRSQLLIRSSAQGKSVSPTYSSHLMFSFTQLLFFCGVPLISVQICVDVSWTQIVSTDARWTERTYFDERRFIYSLHLVVMKDHSFRLLLRIHDLSRN